MLQRIEAILRQLAELQASGATIFFDDICRESPDLLAEVKKRWSEQQEALLETRSILKDDTAPETQTIHRDPYATVETASPDKTPANNNDRHTSRFRFERGHKHKAGGLGVVYFAKDMELDRTVALKQIKSEKSDHPDNRARFIREAEITGNLEHPGIVPIYSLATYEDGNPFYAMRFIEGRTLNDAIRELHHNKDQNKEQSKTPGSKTSLAQRTLEFRKLLARFVGICNAIAFAHSKNILHRDLKPDNIMLGEFGETLVVDWGLAKRFKDHDLVPTHLSSSSHTDANLSGDNAIMGTPHYMSPEQASGETSKLTPASDIYSLGATLYSLLTGNPPFEGNALAVLEKVKTGYFPSPRSIDATISKPLEAICLKAMAKESLARYETAKALAEELEKYLADEPVVAYRETLYEKGRRWMRKHPAMVTSTAVAMVLGICAVSVIAFLQGAHAKELSKKNFDLGIAKTKAEEREKDAINAVKRFGDAVSGNEELKNNRKLESLRKELLKEPIGFFKSLRQRLLTDADTRPESLARLATAVFDLGNLNYEIGQRQDALQSFEESLRIREKVAHENPSVIQFQSDLAGSCDNLGALLSITGRADEAFRKLEKATAIGERVAKASPSITKYRKDLSLYHCNLAKLLASTGKPGDAVAHYGEAIAISQKLAQENPVVLNYQCDLAFGLSSRGSVLVSTGKLSNALADYQKAISIQEQLTQANPSISMFQSDLAHSLDILGVLYSDTSRTQEAYIAYERAKAIRQSLTSNFPSITSYHRDLATSHNNIGVLLARTGDPGGALAAFQQSHAIFDQLVRLNASDTELQRLLGASRKSLGSMLAQTGKQTEALVAYEDAMLVFKRLAAENPSVLVFQSDLAGSYYGIGARNATNGKAEDALNAYEQAKSIQIRLVQESPSETQFQCELADTCNAIGNLLSDIRKSAEALAAYEQALAIFERLSREYPSVSEFQSQLGGTQNNIALLHLNAKRFVEARDLLRLAIKHQKFAFASNPKHPTYRQYLNNHYSNLSLAALGLWDTKSAMEAQKKAMELTLGGPQLEELDQRIARVLQGEQAKNVAECLAFGQRSYELRRFKQASRFYGDALKKDFAIASDRQAIIPYNAACSAALAADGQGVDEPQLDSAGKSKLRTQALTWLKEELLQWQKYLGDAPKLEARQTVAQTLAHWQQDSDLASIRDADKLATLPEAERKEWEALWAEVKALHAKVSTEEAPAAESKPPAEPADEKPNSVSPMPLPKSENPAAPKNESPPLQKL